MQIAEMIPGFQNLPKPIQSLLLNLLILLLALVVIWLVRLILTRIVMVPLRRFVNRSETTMDNEIFRVAERPIRLITLSLGILLVTTIFDFSADIDRFADIVARALLFASVTLFFYYLVDVVGFTTDTLKRFTGIEVEPRLLPFLRTILKVFVLIMGALVIIQEFGYDVTGLIASFGVVGLALSLAAQDTASNVFGFTAIVSDNPFEVGDFIVTPDYSGVVEHVGVRSTRVRKLDQSLVTVPNSNLSDAAVTNWSRLSKRRIDFYIGLTYGTTRNEMEELLHRLREMLRARETIDEESVIVHFVEFGDSALKIRIIAYAMIADWAEYTAEVERVNMEIMRIVEELNLSFAFPSQSLYIETFPGVDQPEKEPVYYPRRRVPRPSDDKGSAEETYQDNPSASSDDEG
jgi:MscS family membrane protein